MSQSDGLQGNAPGREQLPLPEDPTTRPPLQVLAGGFPASILYRRNHQLDFVNRVIMRTNSYISPTAKPFYYRISKTNTWILNFNMNLHFKTLNYPAKRTWMWKKAISSIISLNLKVLIYFNKLRCPYARKLTSKNVKYAQYHLKAYGVLCIFKNSITQQNYFPSSYFLLQFPIVLWGKNLKTFTVLRAPVRTQILRCNVESCVQEPHHKHLP